MKNQKFVKTFFPKEQFSASTAQKKNYVSSYIDDVGVVQVIIREYQATTRRSKSQKNVIDPPISRKEKLKFIFVKQFYDRK